MTKYELLYGVTVDHFPNEKENVTEKLRLARINRNELEKQRPFDYEKQCLYHELTQAITWAEKILRDVSEEI